LTRDSKGRFIKGNIPWWIERGLPHPIKNPDTREKVSQTWFGNLVGPWACEACGEEFQTIGSLGGHVSIHHGLGNKNLIDWRKENGSWNKGLTIDDPRVKANSERSTNTIKEMIATGEYDPTENFGQFAKTGGIPEITSRVLKEYYETHDPWNKGMGYYEPYGPEFTEELRERVRELYNRTCAYCGKSEKENNWRLDVHHKNYDKKDNNINNLTPLCKPCHSVVTNNRCKEVYEE